MPQVKCYQPICLPIDRRLQHHVVIRIAQPWTPQKSETHGFGHQHNRVEQVLYVPNGQSGRSEVLWSRHDGLILQGQGNRYHQHESSPQCCNQQAPGRSGITADRSNHDVGVQDQTHAER